MKTTVPDPHFLQDLSTIFDREQIKSSDLYREVYGRDASYFNIKPQVVLRPHSVEQVVQLIRLLPKHGQHLTFRSGGTSLSGQAVGDGVICDLRTAWNQMEVREKGEKVWFEPGLTCHQVNKILAAHQRKLGPDPASHMAARMGGILANNSSGMQAGTTYNSYRMITSLQFVMANGNRYDSSKAEDHARFEQTERELCHGLMEIRAEILANDTIRNRIIQKYKIKNVTGYGMNSFVDYDNPMDIFIHLLIGSEGTLAFIASAEQNTLPLLNYYSSSILYFKDARLAAAAVPMLSQTEALAVEMMDYASLQSIIGKPNTPPEVPTMSDGTTALLIDFGADSQEELRHIIGTRIDSFKSLDGLHLMDNFTTTVAERERLWYVRDAIFPCVAGARPIGDNVILEDVVAPVDNLYKLVGGLQDLFGKHGYRGSIFGHARDGDLHPLITSGIADKDAVEHFGGFMEEFVGLVLDLNGSLKGEHGTGRAVAPFVEREWGSEIYAMMKRVKQLADPQNILNPGVLISDNPNTHLEHIKEMTPINDHFHVHNLDSCIECGLCEPVCPSRNVTLTPRQRIQAQRVMRAKVNNHLSSEADLLEKEYIYEGRDTCAADGMCKTVCPMEINTGELTDVIRAQQLGKSFGSVLTAAARHFKGTEKIIKETLTLAVDAEHVISPKPFEWTMALGHALSDQVPHWSRNFPKAPRFEARFTENPDIIYFPACVTRIFGSSGEGKANMMQVILRIADRAGIAISLPEEAQGLCCSQIWEHKGDIEGQKIMANKVVEHFWQWSDEGRIPIMCDTTSCTHTLLTSLAADERQSVLTPENLEKYKRLKIVDVTQWLLHDVLTRIEPQHKKGRVLLHPTCACDQMGLTPSMQSIAERCATEVIIPVAWGCCGASGDRGFIFPELGQSAMRDEIAETQGQHFDGCYSLARTCEINMEDHSSYPYESIVYLVDETIHT